jgi:YDG domain
MHNSAASGSSNSVTPNIPTITGTATATAFTTTYGTASAVQSFSVSGANLTANLVATAPTGFEVSSDGTSYVSTATFTQSGGSASGTLRIRLAATAAVSGTYNAQNIVLSSTGATPVNITTAASGNAVSAKALTITGLSGVNKVTDGGNTAALSGTASLSGVLSADLANVTLGGTYTANFGQSTVGTSLPITVSGYTISGSASGNYSLTQPTGLTANIYPVVSTFSKSGSSNWSTATDWTYAPMAATDLVIASGELIVDQTPINVKSITVNPGAKFTLASGKTLNVVGAFTLQSSPSGTATFVDNGGTVSAGSTNVQQYLGTARNWYVSSPLTNAKAPTGYTYYQRDETNASWTSIPFVATNTFNPGTGYIALPDATGATLTFATETGGTINTGDVTVALTYTSSATKKGFNLIGNPYPSHLTWTNTFVDDLTNAALIEPSIYYRTNAGTVNKGGDAAWSFKSYNASSGEFSPSGTTNIIPPMQAFWIRAKAAGNLILDSKLTRSHQASNPLKAPAAKTADRKRLRMEVSNGATTDEALIYFDALADNGYDTYDTPKFEDASAAIQIYTLVSGEPLVMNGMNSIPETEFPLAFTTTSAGTFTLKASQFSNFEAGTQIILTDYADINNPVVTDLSAVGSTYPFTSDVASTTTRFTLKIKGVATGVNPGSNNNFWISTNANGQIVINGANGETTVAVYNSVGQKLVYQRLTSTVKSLCNFVPGVYMVTVTNAGKTLTKKVIID